jgi:diacylglycerol kinase
MPTGKNRRRRLKILRHIFRFRGFVESLKFASIGIFYLFVYHRNMRIIFLTGIAAFLLGLYVRLSGIEMAILSATITLVFMAEIFNTTIELIIDMRLNRYHTLVKLVKDISAAVVLIASLNALAVGFFLFIHKILLKWG